MPVLSAYGYEVETVQAFSFNNDNVYIEEYIESEIIEEEYIEYEYIEKEVLNDSDTKTYMDYRAITDTTSKQYELIHNSGEIIIDEEGYLRDTEGYYGVALGSFFGELGSRYIFTLDTGIELKVIKIEAKSDRHTVDGFYAVDGSVLEFVVDTHTEHLRDAVYPNGYVYSGNFNNCEEFKGSISRIVEVKEEIDD